VLFMVNDTPSIKKAPGAFLFSNPLDALSPHPVMLAPMVGLTHYAVRAALAEFLPEGAKALWPTEMLNSRRIPSQRMNDTPEVCFFDAPNGLCPQLLANEEEFIRLSIPRLEKWGAQAIDINMGCPVQKALKHNYGVALMGDPTYAAEVVRMTVSAATVPVSVKLRASGVRQLTDENAKPLSQQELNRLANKATEIDFEYLTNFIEGLYRAGASWITIHPRTAEQKRRGDANWPLVKRLKDHFAKTEFSNRRIIANGDVQVQDDIRQMFEVTGADRVMIGRALMAKPWLIQYAHGSTEPEPDAFTQHEYYGKFLKSVLAKMKEHYPLAAGRRRFLFLIVYGKPWVEFGEHLYGRIMSAQTYEEMDAALDKFFATKQRILGRTELRV
jgi:tRNA-dihydrouridine synthase